ncbi:hypothetical protein PCASD_00129 [Puccinia coronata f. sp. avenae]|uniref:Rad60/SUMO-like domain-containing protein n=1 Tax=Puccinia coronata f. sp. avenae TaxID=200324 RepID=A0A2N5SDA0_9BASI|nr:hypothetical protein PCASD_21612 [Puccinia coronata f. sp. avenae]PLW52442.1 hypothetical protein PCASD_00129 [Puccinia coronata f. sp. avenae]
MSQSPSQDVKPNKALKICLKIQFRNSSTHAPPNDETGCADFFFHHLFTDTFVPMIYMKDNGVEPLTVKVKRTTTFQKIYNAVAQEKRAELTSFRLCHDGNQLPRDETTPDDWEFEDEELIDYFLESVGGSSQRQEAIKRKGGVKR